MTVVYKPNLDAIGTDSFKFKVNDGNIDSNQATVSLIINDAPVAIDKIRAAVKKNTSLDINLNASVTDADGDTLTLLISQNPVHGVLSAVSGLTVKYTPTANYAGDDSFVYRIKDAKGLYSNTAKVTVTMLNKAPTASNQTIKLDQDTQKEFTLVAKDLDKDSLTVIITQQPSHGKLELGNGLTVKYTPTKSYSGSDSFQFKVNDATVDSNVAKVKLTISKTVTQEQSSGGGSMSWLLLLLACFGVRFKKTDYN